VQLSISTLIYVSNKLTFVSKKVMFLAFSHLLILISLCFMFWHIKHEIKAVSMNGLGVINRSFLFGMKRKQDRDTHLCTEKPQSSAHNQENDFCLTTRSDLIWKPLTTNLCLSQCHIRIYGFSHRFCPPSFSYA
jgi:hypothetical protein